MKQSILFLYGEMDCFAEPVIGRAFARPWLAMTAWWSSEGSISPSPRVFTGFSHPSPATAIRAPNRNFYRTFSYCP